MRDIFPGYYRKPPDQIKNIWKVCNFAFDANVLLNLYRYSSSTADSIIGIMSKLSQRLWLPWQAAHEFHSNRLDVISRQTKSYKSTEDAASQLIRALESPREHPFVDEETLVIVRDSVYRLQKSLASKQEDRRKLLVHDPLLDKVSDLFSGRVGASPTPEALAERLRESKVRCEKRIPPGFKDSDKEGDRAFGDVLIWFELIDYSKKSKKPLVFVTDDAKSDWWLSISGQTIGPRPEIVQEFVRETAQQILLYRPDRFAEYASEFMSENIAPAVVSEIRSRSEDRVLRSGRARARLSDSADELVQLCQHLWVHREDARQLLRAVQAQPDTHWSSVRSPLEIANEAASEIDAALLRCRCLSRLVERICAITPPGLQAASEELNGRRWGKQLGLLHEVFQLPDIVQEFVRTHRFRESK